MSNYPDGMTLHDWATVGAVEACEHGAYTLRGAPGCRECFEQDPDDARDARIERQAREQDAR